MPRRRNNNPWDERLTSPCWVSLVLAFLVYVGIKWVLLYGVAWIFALPFVLVAGASAFISYRRRALLDSRAGLESLRGLSWQDFERLVGEAYRTHGYVVEELGGTAPHGGVDLLLHRRGSKVVIQCKRWKSSQVGVSLIREF